MEETLMELARWGKPMVSQFSDGSWYVTVDMRVNATGVSFEVKARGDDQSVPPSVVAKECLARVNKVVSELSSGASLKRLK